LKLYEEPFRLQLGELRREGVSMSETVLDLRGLRCPEPVLRAKRTLRNVPVGGILVLECTDPLTVIDVPHFVNQTGHTIAAQERNGELYVFKIVKKH
jgi:tRNA 2-thiouridine synthesizing protein A